MFHIQVHGVALGLPLSSILTKILLLHHEKNYLNECPAEFKPTFNRKYVDDIFMLFESPESPSCFENIRLDFSVEHKEVVSLFFLGIKICCKKGKLIASVY